MRVRVSSRIFSLANIQRRNGDMKKKSFRLKIALTMLLVVMMLFSFAAVTVLAASGDTSSGAEESTELFKVTYIEATDTEKAKLDIRLSADVAVITSMKKEDLARFKDELYDAIYMLSYDSVVKASADNGTEGAVLTADEETSVIIPPDLDLDSINVKELEAFLRSHLNDTDAKEKFEAVMSGEYDAIISIAIDKYVNRDGAHTYDEVAGKVTDIVNEYVPIIYADEPEVIEEKKALTENKIIEVVSEVKDATENGEKFQISVEDVLTSITTIEIGETAADRAVVYKDNVFVNDEVMHLINNLPNLAEVKDFTNEEMVLDYSVLVTMAFGEIDFDLTIGFLGDCEDVRRAAEIVSRYLTYSVDQFGAYTVEVKVPEGVSRVIEKALSSNEISDTIKRKIISALSGNVDNLEALVTALTFEEVVEVCEAIDFQPLLDKEPFASIERFKGLTNDEIVNKIKESRDIYDKAKELILKVFDILPDSAGEKALKDIYKGSGEFFVNVDRIVNLETAVSSISEKYGALIAAWFEKPTIDVKASVTLKMESFSRAILKLSDTEIIADGFLPEGADLFFFANKREHNGKDIVAWADASGNKYTKMPSCDVELTPVYDYVEGLLTVEGSEDIDDVYAPGKEHTVSVEYAYNPYVEGAAYTVETLWYKIVGSKTVFVTDEKSFTVSSGADSGEYFCRVMVTEGSKVTYFDSRVISVKIAKLQIDASVIAWDYTPGEFTYNGNAHRVELTGMPTGFSANYTDNEFTSAGDYTASYELVYNADNYEIVGTPVGNLPWSINKAKIDVTALVWDYNPADYVYNGSEKTVVLKASTISPLITSVTYQGNTAIMPNEDGAYYTASYVLNYDEDNYYLVGEGSGTLEWRIEKISIYIGEMAWDYTPGAFVYSGQKYTVTLKNIPEFVTVNYFNNEYTLAGEYVASYALKYDRAIYKLAGFQPGDLEWSIDKATYDMSGVSFKDKTVKYDGKAHFIVIEGKLPDGVTVAYSASRIEPGVYSMAAIFSGDYVNYNAISSMSATLTIVDPNAEGGDDAPDNKDFSYVDKDGNVIVDMESKNPIAGDVTFSVEDKSEDYADFDFSDAVGEGKEATLGAAYDMHFVKGGAVHNEVGNSFTVRLLIPKDLRAKEHLIVVHIADDGALTVMESVRDGNYMEFETNHFSVYAVIAVDDAPETDIPWWIFLIIAIILLVIVIIVLVIILIKRRGGKNEGDGTEPTAEPEPDNKPDGSAEETIAEEAPAEEAPAEEAPAEEAPAEEAPVEEAPAEEAPAEEAPVEEAPVEEAPAEAAPVMPVIITEGDKVIVGGEEIAVRYRSSFTSRLIQAEAPIQDYYTTLKNYILSFKGIKAKSSWNYENFNKGRVQCVRVNVKGKAILVNLALDPAEYNVNKYHFQDMSSDSKFAEIPMQMKVKSDRSLKYTLELIDAVMAKLGIAQGEIPEVDYHMPYEPNSALAERKLVKMILPAGVKLEDVTVLHEADVSQLLESFRSTEATENVPEAVVEEAPAEEASVEEAPVEETPVEEAPVEEAPAEEAPAPIAPIITSDAAAPFGDDAVMIRYRSSFTSRLIQSEGEIQDYYTALKNHLLSYNGVKAKTSWNYENFNKGRVQCARINIKGKTLTINLALAPTEYSATKYHFTDVSDDPKFDKLPMLLKVRSARALKYAIELIDALMATLGIVKGVEQNEDYRMPYEPNSALAARGLMKIILPKGVKAEDAAAFVEADVNEILAKNTSEAPAEEVPIEEAPAEEAPIEEAPIEEAPVEEAPIEEAPIEEAPIEEAPIEEASAEVEIPVENVYHEAVVQTTAEEADALVDDKSATEHIEKINVARSGKMVEINIETLCENFENGDVVTLDKLKAMRLVNRNAGRLKVLAKGTMTKCLTVEADKFSLQAVKMITLAGGAVKQYK